jgi:Flagellar protein FliT
MTVYEQILEITRNQADAAAAGDLNTAIALQGPRGELIAAAPPATATDEPVIRATLALDRNIATAIRERMLAIRDEMLAARKGQQALAGYANRPTTQNRFAVGV